MSYSPVAAASPQQKSCASVDVIEHRLGVLTPRCVLARQCKERVGLSDQGRYGTARAFLRFCGEHGSVRPLTGGTLVTRFQQVGCITMTSRIGMYEYCDRI
jgi:hypothetical protein